MEAAAKLQSCWPTPFSEAAYAQDQTRSHRRCGRLCAFGRDGFVVVRGCVAEGLLAELDAEAEGLVALSHLDLNPVDRPEFGSGAVAMRLEPRR